MQTAAAGLVSVGGVTRTAGFASSDAVAISLVTGLAALLLLGRVSPRLLRCLSAAAAAALVVAWAVAQAPYLLGTHAAVSASAAPHATLVTLVAIVAVAVAVVVPSLTLLYFLQQRAGLGE